MKFYLIYYFIILPICAMILVLLGIIEDRIFYDLNVDGELIKGCHCRFHPFRHELEITNPATGRVIVTTYEYYSIERRYFKRRKKEEEE